MRLIRADILGRRASATAWAREAVWALSDQALISSANFFLTALLARSISAYAFGIYSLLFIILLFFNSIQLALITQPHNVLGAGRKERDYKDLTMTVGMVQGGLLGLIALIGVMTFAVGMLMDHSSSKLILVVTVAALTWQVQEFARRVLYTEQRIAEAFSVDLIGFGGQSIAITVLWSASALTATSALLALASTSFLASLWGLWLIRSALTGQLARNYVREIWAIGKWLGATTVLYWLWSQAYPLVAALVEGPEAVAVIRATLLIVAPCHVLMNAYQTAVIPRASERYNEGDVASASSFVLKSGMIAAIPLLVFLLLVGIFGKTLLRALYGGRYDGYEVLIWLWGLNYVALFASQVLTVGLTSIRMPHFVTYGNALGAVTAVATGVGLISVWGVYGAAAGAAVSTLLMDVVLGYSYWRRRRAFLGGETRSANPNIFAK